MARRFTGGAAQWLTGVANPDITGVWSLGQHAISFWYRRRSGGVSPVSSTHMGMSTADGAPQGRLYHNVADGAKILVRDSGGGYDEVGNNVVFPVDVWKHVVINFASNGNTIGYLDNVLTWQEGIASIATTEPLYAFVYNLHADVAELAVYRRHLTATERGRLLAGELPPDIDYAAVMRYWPVRPSDFVPEEGPEPDWKTGAPLDIVGGPLPIADTHPPVVRDAPVLLERSSPGSKVLSWSQYNDPAHPFVLANWTAGPYATIGLEALGQLYVAPAVTPDVWGMAWLNNVDPRGKVMIHTVLRRGSSTTRQAACVQMDGLDTNSPRVDLSMRFGNSLALQLREVTGAGVVSSPGNFDYGVGPQTVNLYADPDHNIASWDTVAGPVSGVGTTLTEGRVGLAVAPGSGSLDFNKRQIADRVMVFPDRYVRVLDVPAGGSAIVTRWVGDNAVILASGNEVNGEVLIDMLQVPDMTLCRKLVSLDSAGRVVGQYVPPAEEFIEPGETYRIPVFAPPSPEMISPVPWPDMVDEDGDISSLGDQKTYQQFVPIRFQPVISPLGNPVEYQAWFRGGDDPEYQLVFDWAPMQAEWIWDAWAALLPDPGEVFEGVHILVRARDSVQTDAVSADFSGGTAAWGHSGYFTVEGPPAIVRPDGPEVGPAPVLDVLYRRDNGALIRTEPSMNPKVEYQIRLLGEDWQTDSYDDPYMKTASGVNDADFQDQVYEETLFGRELIGTRFSWWTGPLPPETTFEVRARWMQTGIFKFIGEWSAPVAFTTRPRLGSLWRREVMDTNPLAFYRMRGNEWSSSSNSWGDPNYPPFYVQDESGWHGGYGFGPAGYGYNNATMEFVPSKMPNDPEGEALVPSSWDTFYGRHIGFFQPPFILKNHAPIITDRMAPGELTHFHYGFVVSGITQFSDITSVLIGGLWEIGPPAVPDPDVPDHLETVRTGRQSWTVEVTPFDEGLGTGGNFRLRMYDADGTTVLIDIQTPGTIRDNANAGPAHLIEFGYDQMSDRAYIWLDGMEVASAIVAWENPLIGNAGGFDMTTGYYDEIFLTETPQAIADHEARWTALNAAPFPPPIDPPGPGPDGEPPYTEDLEASGLDHWTLTPQGAPAGDGIMTRWQMDRKNPVEDQFVTPLFDALVDGSPSTTFAGLNSCSIYVARYAFYDAMTERQSGWSVAGEFRPQHTPLLRRRHRLELEETGALKEGTSTSVRPDAISMDYLVSHALGPRAVAVTTFGLLDRAWKATIEENNVQIQRENDTGDGWDDPIHLFTYDAEVNGSIKEMDLAFEQNARPVLCAERPSGVDGAPELWIYFYDATVPGYVFQNFGPGAHPRCALDDPKDVVNSDVMVFYANPDTLLLEYRRQRDRYAIVFDMAVEDGVGDGIDVFVQEVARAQEPRLIVVIARRFEDGGYCLHNVISSLYPVHADPEGINTEHLVVSAGTGTAIEEATTEPEGMDTNHSVVSAVTNSAVETDVVEPEAMDTSHSIVSAVTNIAVLEDTSEPEEIDLSHSILSALTETVIFERAMITEEMELSHALVSVTVIDVL